MRGRAAGRPDLSERRAFPMENGKFGGREVVIVEAVRTPIGRGHEEKGYYKDVHPSNLLAKTYSELIERTGIEASEVEDVIAGCVQQFGEQGLNIGRNAWLEAGLPIETPATTVDRQCGSAQQAVNFGAALVAAGVHDVVIGSGAEHQGRISFAAALPTPARDGAAAVLLMTPEKAKELGVTPRAKIVDQTTVGVDPVIMLTGPIPATRKLLGRNGLKIDDLDLIEINEAFAPVIAAWRRELEPDMDRVNVNGGAMALGHPLGSTGARLITTLLHELERSDKETGLVTMCCGGGLGTGTLIQRV